MNISKEAKLANIHRQPAGPMTFSRKVALAAGILYLLTFVSIPTLSLYAPVLKNPNYIAGPGPDTAVVIGGILEIIVALAGIGTAVALYPVVKRQNEGMALGFIGSRILEAATIFAGVVSLLAVVSLRQAGVGANGLVTGQALVALYNWFHLGQNLMPCRECLAAGHPVVPVAPGAAYSPPAGIYRRTPAHRQHGCHDVRRQRAALFADGHRRSPDRGVGVFAGRLAHRERVQSICNHFRACKTTTNELLNAA